MNWRLRGLEGGDEVVVPVPEALQPALLDAFGRCDALLGLDPYRDRRIDGKELPRALTALREGLEARRDELRASVGAAPRGQAALGWRERWIDQKLEDDALTQLLRELLALFELAADGTGELEMLGL